MLRQLASDFLQAVDRVTQPRLRVVQRRFVHTIPEQEHLKKMIRYFDIDCIFDVGANMGQYAQMLRKQINYKGYIISFEPIPHCVKNINMLAQNDENWKVEQLALSDIAGETTFNIMQDTEFSSLASPNSRSVDLGLSGNRINQTISVKIDTLAHQYDILKSRLGFKAAYLKMDTQGNDLRVAEGGGDRLTEFVGIQSELSVVPIYRDIPTYIESIAYYESRGFKLSALVPNNPGHFPRLVEVDCIMYNELKVAAKEIDIAPTSSSSQLVV